jgi:hypothetical protein
VTAFGFSVHRENCESPTPHYNGEEVEKQDGESHEMSLLALKCEMSTEGERCEAQEDGFVLRTVRGPIKAWM